MKRTIYLIIMMIFFVMMSVSLYYCLIFSLVFYRFVDVHHVIPFTYLALSRDVFIFIACLGVISGYFFGKKWWQIIYVDKVYYFGEPSRMEKTVAQIKGIFRK